ncbi:cyanophycinase [Inhella gelatinilytica]|uniref:Cyanophycinase n=1 Tax=Inhella gelatinilytica TaxID=2795030 RepID=A0A931IYN6_9BURK|nr:cyanophycinase [Inhella gelatinilytica]MBH9552241.1 cyanophycinase [Inhella gelatinilytica]
MNAIRTLVALLTCWPLWGQAQTAVVAGGALRFDNDAVWQRIVDEAGGRGAPIAVFATAAGNPARSGALIVEALQRRGAQARFIPVAPKLKGVDLPQQLNDPALIEQVRQSRGVFFSGGAQELIVDTLQPGGEATPMLQAIRQVFDRGGVVAGTSAGAAIMSRMMFRDAQDNHQILKGRWRAGQEYDRGLGFVGPDLFIDQHFLKRGRIGRLLPAMQALGYGVALGVEENSAVVVKQGEVEVIGQRGALLVDLREAVRDAREPHFNLKGAVLSYLDSGDRHHLGTGVTTPSAHKLREPRLDPAAPDFNPGLQGEPYFLDILGDQTVVTAMAHLIEGGLPEVRGLAYRARPRPDDEAPELGFEFRLYTGPGTVGWFTGARGGEDYTLLKVRLDVRPVRVVQPLVQPWAPPEPAAPSR